MGKALKSGFQISRRNRLLLLVLATMAPGPGRRGSRGPHALGLGGRDDDGAAVRVGLGRQAFYSSFRRAAFLGWVKAGISEPQPQYPRPFTALVLERIPERPAECGLDGVQNSPVEPECGITSLREQGQQGANVLFRQRSGKGVKFLDGGIQLFGAKIVRQGVADGKQALHRVLNHTHSHFTAR